MRELLDRIDVHAVALSRIDRTHLTLVAKASRDPGFDAPPSFRLPAFAPFGASVAAFWTSDAQAQWLDTVPDTTTREHLRRFLTTIRDTGVAVWRDVIATPVETSFWRTLVARGGEAVGWYVPVVLSMLLVGVSPFDPVAMTGAVVLCVAVTVFACYLPVRRAMRIAASDALKAD